MELIGPRPLPRLELRDGVPPSMRTLVVVPTLLTSDAEIDEHINRLEIHYLANPDGDVHFALLSDWSDAPAETMPEDDRLLATAIEGIARLNRRARSLLPVPATASSCSIAGASGIRDEGKWMGWERKRGKLDELNQLLRGAGDTTFVAAGGRRPTCPPASATWSPSTPTRACREAPSIASSARWPIR